MQPSSMIILEGVLSFAVPVGLAVAELIALRRPLPPPLGRWVPDPAPLPPAPPQTGAAAPRARVRVLEDA